MRTHASSARARFPAWRSFDRRDGREIQRALRAGGPIACPCCDGFLETRPSTRFRECLVLDARGFDLDCRACRRFWCVVRHTPRSLRLIRMRRLVAAVRVIGGRMGATPHAAPSNARPVAA
jgi:hypothetical protein